MKHKTNLKSPRLQATLGALSDGLWHTGQSISRGTRSMAVHSDIADLRASRVPVECKYSHRTPLGRKVYIYRLAPVKLPPARKSAAAGSSNRLNRAISRKGGRR